MNEENPSPYHGAEFKALLAKYEDMRVNRTQAYFEADELQTLSDYYAGMGDFQTAEKVIDYALTLHPDDQDLNMSKCRMLVANGCPEDAQKLLDTLPDLDEYEARLIQAEIYLDQGQTRKAESLFKEVYDNDPDVDSMLDIAQICIERQYKELAYTWLKKAFDENPEDLEVRELMGSFYFMFGQFDKAAKTYNKLLDKEPYTIEFWQNLARCYIRMECPEKGLEAIEFAMTIDDTDLISWEIMGNCYILMNETEKSIRCFRHIEKKAIDKTYAQSLLLDMYFNLMMYTYVLLYTHRLLTSPCVKDDDKPEIYYKQAVAYLSMNQPELCAGSIRQGLAYNNHYTNLYIAQGDLYLFKGDTTGARQAFDYAIRYASFIVDTRTTIASVYLRNNFPAEALAEYKTLEESYREENRSNYFLMAFCYFQLGMKKEVLTYLVRGAVYSPSLAESPQMESFSSADCQNFIDLCRTITQKVNDGELDPTPYLEEE